MDSPAALALLCSLRILGVSKPHRYHTKGLKAHRARGEATGPWAIQARGAWSCLVLSFLLSPKELAVRLGCGLCTEEQAFLSRRKQVVAKALKEVLQLDRDLQEDEVWGLCWVGDWGLSQTCPEL